MSGIYKQLIGQDVHTFTCLFRAYRRSVLERISFRGDGFSAVAEIFLRAMLEGYVVREVPMPLERRRFGESKLKVSDAVPRTCASHHADHVGRRRASGPLLALTSFPR